MGTGYKGGASHYHSLGENAPALKSKYKFKESTGYFGDPGKNSGIRVIVSEDPLKTAKNFYNTGAYGGVETTLPNGKGVSTEMRDGTKLVFRETSKSGSPAVSIQIQTIDTDTGKIKTQKIHFELGK